MYTHNTTTFIYMSIQIYMIDTIIAYEKYTTDMLIAQLYKVRIH